MIAGGGLSSYRLLHVANTQTTEPNCFSAFFLSYFIGLGINSGTYQDGDGITVAYMHANAWGRDWVFSLTSLKVKKEKSQKSHSARQIAALNKHLRIQKQHIELSAGQTAKAHRNFASPSF